MIATYLTNACRLEGIPIIYQGQEQHYAGGETPGNREALWLSGYSTNSELYKWITKLNRIRTWAIAQDPGYLAYRAWPVYSDSHTIAMRKGFGGTQVLGIFTNSGSSSSPSITLSGLDTGFGPNQAVTDVMSCSSLIADSDGGMTVTLAGGISRVLYPTHALLGSGICSPGGTTTSTRADISSSRPTPTHSDTTRTTATACAATMAPLPSPI